MGFNILFLKIAIFLIGSYLVVSDVLNLITMSLFFINGNMKSVRSFERRNDKSFHLRKLRLRESELESRSICYQVNDVLKKAGKPKLLRKHFLFLGIFIRQRIILFVLVLSFVLC